MPTPQIIIVKGTRTTYTPGATAWYTGAPGHLADDIEGVEPSPRRGSPFAANDPRFDTKPKFNLKTILKNVARGLKGPPTPQTIMAIITEAAIFAGLDYIFDNIDSLTPEELQLGQELLRLANQAPAPAHYAQELILKAQSDGALQELSTLTLEGVPELQYTPRPAPVPRTTPYEVVVQGTQTPRGVDFSIKATDTFVNTFSPEDLVFDDISRISYDPHGVHQPGRDVVLVPIEGGLPEVIQSVLSNPKINTLENDMSINYDSLLEDLPQVAPIGTIELDTSVAEAIQIAIRVNTGDGRIKEENTNRDDSKDKDSSVYLGFINFINSTFGKITEIDDFSLALQNNIVAKWDRDVCIANDNNDGVTCIRMKKDQRLGELPIPYKTAMVRDIIANREGMTLDVDNFIMEYTHMQLTDITIALTTKIERHFLDKYNIRGIVDYGNLSTWIKRANSFLGEFANEKPTPLDSIPKVI